MEMIIDFPGGSRVDAHFGNFTVATDQPPVGRRAHAFRSIPVLHWDLRGHLRARLLPAEGPAGGWDPDR